MTSEIPGVLQSTVFRGGHGDLIGLRAGEGAGKKAVLVHGFTGSKEDFLELLPRLAASGFDVVAYDQVGAFESDGPEHPDAYTMESFAADLRGVIEQHGGGAPIHVMGHSFGGMVVRAAHELNPASFLSVALLCTPALLAEGAPSASPFPAEVLQAVRVGGTSALWELMGEDLPSMGVPDDKLAFLERRILATRAENVVGIANLIGSTFTFNESLRRASTPVLVGYGLRDDVVVPDEQPLLAKAIGARVVTYDSGHLPNEECPEKLAADLVQFWGDVSQS